VGRDRLQALPLATRGDQRVSMWTLTVLACTMPPGAAPLNIWSMEQGTVQEAFVAAIEGPGAGARGSLRVTDAAAEQPAWFAWSFRVAVSASRED
jgi:hypothetical protein